MLLSAIYYKYILQQPYYTNTESLTYSTPPTVFKLEQELSDLNNLFSEDGIIGSLNWTYQIDIRPEKTFVRIFGCLQDEYSDTLVPQTALEDRHISSHTNILNKENIYKKQGILDDDANLCLYASLEIDHNHPQIIKSGRYDTRNLITGTGVTTRFYNALEEILARSGFTLLFGLNNSVNEDFYINKLHRILFDDAPEHIQAAIRPLLDATEEKWFCTVKALNPTGYGRSFHQVI